jgi:hypothetical protein
MVGMGPIVLPPVTGDRSVTLRLLPPKLAGNSA